MSTNKQAKGNELHFPSHVYVLTFEKWDNKRDTATEVIGVYSSKEAAVAVSGDVGTDHGTFDEAIEPDRGTFGEDYLHEDNRGNPPDNGVLIQFGGRGVFEGDYRRLYIRKMPLLGMSAVKSHRIKSGRPMQRLPSYLRQIRSKRLKRSIVRWIFLMMDLSDNSDSSDDDNTPVVYF